ncbi:MAG: methionine--tRNA ligase [Alphaproteobacteria bacterium]|jgi:methionyl-tRNA synthetase|nr:methionine--tRNA ligase [Thalassospira sp.]MCE2964946.1 methionine--tRNA ligase [Alphaproteobacteria bacterium]
MSAPCFVTTPIYYVNDKPHIGHAYTTIAADVYARAMRLAGRDVFFMTGTDEHGQKVEQSAAKAGISPQAFTDAVSQNFRDLAARLNISNNAFIRTTEPRHYKACQALWQRLEERGHIYLGSYAGWYSVRDEAYYQESELIDGKAPTGAPVEWVEEPSYFFRLSAFQEPLLKLYADNPDFIAPSSRRNEVMRFVEGGLKDLSVSRTTFSWGVPVPGNPAHIMYVWLDALTNYLTVLGYPEKTPDFSTFWPASLHLVGKDIVRFHAVYWPAFLMAAELPVPKRVFAHGWWTNEGQKISKSVGNVIDPIALIEQYGVDPVRYFLMREVPFGGDGDFAHAAVQRRLNKDLADDYGNLCQRVLAFIQKNAGAAVPLMGNVNELDNEILGKAYCLNELMFTHIEVQAYSKALELFNELVAAANGYVDKEAPWALKKTNPERMGTVLAVLLEVIRCAAICLQPFTPALAGQVLDQLAVPLDARTFGHASDSGALKPGTPLPAPQPLVKKWSEA